MINILTKPDHFELLSFAIEPVVGVLPDLDAGEMVDLLMDPVTKTRTIRQISGDPVGNPVPVFSDTERRAEVGDVLSCGKTSVVIGEIEFETDKFADALTGAAEYDPLTVHDGVWLVAVSGKKVYGQLMEVPSAIATLDGIAVIRRVSIYQIP